MLDLGFQCTRIEVERQAAGPALAVGLRITEGSGARVEAIVLRCQVRVEPRLRRYSEHEADRLVDLFGTPTQWAGTMHPFQLATVSHVVPRFQRAIETTMSLPCTYDMEVASGKYFASLDDGEIPLALLFSGSVFTGATNGFAAEPVPWHHEASYRLPVATWRDMMDHHFPGRGWIALRRDTIDALRSYATSQAMVDNDDVIERLLKEAGWTPR